MTITPTMIQTFIDVYTVCDGKRPCQHGHITISLIDGREITTLLTSNQIANILAQMKNGREHPLWTHFARYHRNQENNDPTEILTVLFQRFQK